ncbi:hypothetical protein QO003_000105 [Arthrobacter silviterrae]|uniref:DUF2567 domain-containing protein n=1 Tax=Arthrobacter silviterrae TaxID=2026658 RepID=A0ABX0D869_9MICC|nr:hypothetical protein [Arthrobacter silviterrae]MDQ0275802.1 hypothetical protein [Arthrobacter silviterrae]NGN83099.1 hypothetical protein [Arthrobacter silviterrae]
MTFIGGAWLRWFALSALAGIGLGALWWLAAPGGAVYGDVRDYNTWLGRDLVLGVLAVAGGLASACLLVGAGRRRGAVSTAHFAAVILGALLGSVLAWRTGVFAGDLFHVPPANMASPSMVFSLRVPSILLLWPLACAATVFVWTTVNYAIVPSPQEARATAGKLEL